MITDIAAYLRYFEGFRRRTERDVAALPPGAAAWRPPAADGETGWSIGQIVAHIGGTRLYFASAYRNDRQQIFARAISSSFRSRENAA